MLTLALMICSPGCCGPAAACFSSNWRICRSSFRISSACSLVIPLFLAPRGETNSGSTAHVAYRKKRFIEHLILFEDQHVLAVFDLFPFRNEPEMVRLDFFDHIRFVEADMVHGITVRHCPGGLVIFHDYQFTIGFEPLVNACQHS